MKTISIKSGSAQRKHPGTRVLEELTYTSLQGVHVCFINMPLRERAVPNVPPQGPALMAARCRQYGAQVSIIDLNAYRIKDALLQSEGFKTVDTSVIMRLRHSSPRTS